MHVSLRELTFYFKGRTYYFLKVRIEPPNLKLLKNYLASKERYI